MYSTNKTSTIIFDMDGTVLESEGLFSIAEQRLLSDYGIQIKLDELVAFRGMSEDDFYPNFTEKFQINDSKENIKRKLQEYFFIIMKSHLHYIRGFKNFYKNIIQRYNLKTALVTNTSLDIVIKIREHINIDRYFSLIITSCDVSQPKPSPVPYRSAMSGLSSDSENTIIIEDSRVGFESALGSGAEVFGITSTLSREDIIEIDVRIQVFDHYRDITNFLEKRL